MTYAPMIAALAAARTTRRASTGVPRGAPGRRPQLSAAAQAWLDALRRVEPASVAHLDLVREFHALPPAVQQELLDALAQEARARTSIADEYQAAVEEHRLQERLREYEGRQQSIDAAGVIMSNRDRVLRQQMREAQVLRAGPLSAFIFGTTGSVDAAEIAAGLASMVGTRYQFAPRPRPEPVPRQTTPVGRMAPRPSVAGMKPPIASPYDPIPAKTTPEAMPFVYARMKTVRGRDARAEMFKVQGSLMKLIHASWEAWEVPTRDNTRIFVGGKEAFALVITQEGRIFAGPLRPGMLVHEGPSALRAPYVNADLTHPQWSEK